MDPVSMACLGIAGYLGRLLWQQVHRSRFEAKNKSDDSFWDFVIGEYQWEDRSRLQRQNRITVWLK